MVNAHKDFNTAPLDPALEQEVKSIVDDLSLTEKVKMLSGHGFFEKFFGEENRQFGQRAYPAGSGNERHDIPSLYFCDGPRGARHKRNTTCFPVTMARGATWDRDIERRVGEAIAIEARALGASISGAVCINLLRHPAWGRAQETYGEDPVHLGEMGAALTEGLQTHNIIATAKHFAVNSIENSRFKVDVRVTDRALHEVYLPHFKRVLMSGCASVMSAYNKINGDYCAHSVPLLRNILKEQWGFRGFVHSDWVKGCYGADAVTAGLDVEMPEGIFYGSNLEGAVKRGEVDEAHVDEAVTRILRTQFTFARADDPRTYSEEDLACDAHIQLSREVAGKSFVLLKNDGLLPLDRDKAQTIAVIGKLAAEVNLGDRGSSSVNPPYAVTILDGLKSAAGPDTQIVFDDGSDPARMIECAKAADVVIAIVGYTWEDEGEFIPGNEALEGLDPDKQMPSRGGDRSSLNLLKSDEDMIANLSDANDRLLVGVMSGSAVIMESWRNKPAAIMMIWYPGMEGGNAFASAIFGDINPEGRLPFTIPTDADHLPFFDAEADDIKYGLYHGYTLLEKSGQRAAFPFGFGLGYTEFTYGNIRATKGDKLPTFEIDVTNTGDKPGTETVQFYIGFGESLIDRPVKLLRGFEKLFLRPGETKTVAFSVTHQDLAYYDETSRSWQVEPVGHTAHIGANCEDALTRTVRFETEPADDS